MFGFNTEKWRELNGLNTATEIYQQPKLWLETLKIIESNRKNINKFMEERLEKERIRVIFTGAGTSAYIGDLITPQLNRRKEYIYEAIPTTHIVENPETYLKKDTPTILVSFGRSGNSPESIATYTLGNELVEDIGHIFITCNKEGQLAQISQDKENVLLLLMPEQSNDKGFAMTSSFSCMSFAALQIFNMDDLESNREEIMEMISIGKSIINKGYESLIEICNYDYKRIVYLGSSSFYGLTKESALKLLELTRGRIISYSETVLGFRHGPKSIVDDDTLVFIYISDDPYTRKYDLDLLSEIYHDIGEHKVIAISNNYYEEVQAVSNHYLYLSKSKNNITNMGLISLLYALYAQIFALLSSIKAEIEPDNPSPSGLVNRVVKGVTIYEYK
jgi:tagatose-6-phosphate ketose/aldose isomerase